MPERVRYITRPATRQLELLRLIRGRILSGRYRPGEKLPTHRELEKRHSAGRRTVELVLAKLSDDGFVVPRGRAGTFVADAPPHVSRYALVFPFAPVAAGWSQFHTALQRVAEAFDDGGARQVLCFHGGGAVAAGYQQLLDEVVHHRLAGVIFAPTPDSFAGTPLASARVPSVQIGGSGPARHTVVLDYASFADQALGYFVRRRRCRVAVIALGSSYAWVKDIFEGAAARHGVAIPRRWAQSIASPGAGWLRNCLELMLPMPRSDRPDALVLLDDNLVRDATEELRALKVRVPEDLEIVAHANFPWPTPSSLPLCRIGFDLRRTLDVCVKQLDLMRLGRRVSLHTHIPATTLSPTMET